MIYRIDVRPRPGLPGADAFARNLLPQIQALGIALKDVNRSRVFLLQSAEPLSRIRRIASELLADPIVEQATAVECDPADATEHSANPDDHSIAREDHKSSANPTAKHIDRETKDDRCIVEVHLKPGVMDPTAASTLTAIADAGVVVSDIRTGWSYTFRPAVDETIRKLIADRLLANGVVEHVFYHEHRPTQFPQAPARDMSLKHVALRGLNDSELITLSRNGHLFLNLAEMRAAQEWFVAQGREPTDIELETVAQTWSEHCVHKTLKSPVNVVNKNGRHLRSYKNLIKETIFASTTELMNRAAGKERRDFDIGTIATNTDRVTTAAIDATTVDTEVRPTPTGTAEHAAETVFAPPADFCLSVFKDNAGVIAFDETDAVCFKVETHNRPSALEPYGGAATGIGGCIRDVLGTGLGARPIANTDVFCVAYPDREGSPNGSAGLPTGVIHPRRILQQVVAGVRDYGNRMGIPTVNGALYFNEQYVGNPLVFAGCAGIIPRDRIEKKTDSGDAIVLLGGRTGRDGIHGATFSSAELTNSHADEFSHAVQIGNAIEQKRLADVLLAARDASLFSAVTDCGAGGLSSAIGEMGAELGATVELDKVPLKYAGLRYDEIWISEAQERMVLSVPQDNVQRLLTLAAEEDVEATIIGRFGTERAELILNHSGVEVGRLSMEFLHEGVPLPTRTAVVDDPSDGSDINTEATDGCVDFPSNFPNVSVTPVGEKDRGRIASRLLRTLAHPNVASRHWIIRQYDHEVQGGTIIKPLVGRIGIGPGDAAVIRPKPNSTKAIVLSCGMAVHVRDPYLMAIASIDEAVRNAVCVGARLEQMAVLDNFCWPGTDNEPAMGSLVRAAEGCCDVALAFGIPFISGKDSLHNQFTDRATGRVIKIPPTLLISAIGVIDDWQRCLTMDFKQADRDVVLIQPFASPESEQLSGLNLLHRRVSRAINAGQFAAVHDVSDGGIITAVAEMAIASGIGFAASEEAFAVGGNRANKTEDDLFRFVNGTYVAEIADRSATDSLVSDFREVAKVSVIGQTHDTAEFNINRHSGDVTLDTLTLDEMTRAFRGTLDW